MCRLDEANGFLMLYALSHLDVGSCRFSNHTIYGSGAASPRQLLQKPRAPASLTSAPTSSKPSRRQETLD